MNHVEDEWNSRRLEEWRYFNPHTMSCTGKTNCECDDDYTIFST